MKTSKTKKKVVAKKKKVETFTHKCIRGECSNTYKDSDIDPYYCPSCKEEAQKIAKAIDKKLKGKVRKNTQSDLQIAMTKGKTMPSANGGFSTFVRASDLGINLNP